MSYLFFYGPDDYDEDEVDDGVDSGSSDNMFDGENPDAQDQNQNQGKSAIDRAKDGYDRGKKAKDKLGKSGENAGKGAKKTGNAAQKGSDAGKQGLKSAEKGAQTAKKGADAAKTAKKGADAAKAAKAAGNAGKFAKFIAPMMPWIIYVIIAIAIIIAVVGILMFILTLPGLIWGKIVAIAQDFGNTLINFAIGSENNVKTSQIAQSADFLEQMGYDLHAYGFLSDQVIKKGNDYYAKYGDYKIDYDSFFDSNKREIDHNSLYVTDNGILKDKDGIVDVESEYLYMYLVSDNYVYIISNNNSSLVNMWKSVTNFSFFRDLFTGNFGSGLITLYHEGGGGLGNIGNPISLGDQIGGFFAKLLPFSVGSAQVDVSIDIDSKQMVVTSRPNGYWGKQRKLLYDLDGWTGRYGMPLEFLLSLHLTCMQPDLVTDLIRQTETEVQMVLHESNVSVEVGTKVNGKIMNREDFENAYDEELAAAQKAYDDAHKAYRESLGLTHWYDIFTGDNFADTEEGKRLAAAIEAVNEKYGTSLMDDMDEVAADFTTLIPYIYRVKNHWFRDVYFVDVSEDGYIDVDTRYEAETGERWTLYETVDLTDEQRESTKTTVTDSNAVQSEYSSGGLGTVQYVLYKYCKDSNGKQIYNSDGSFKEEVYMYNGKYGTKEDAEIDTSLNPGEADSLHKKAIEKKIENWLDDEAAGDDYYGLLGGTVAGGANAGKWMAYKEVPDYSTSSWTQYEVGENDEVSEENSGNIYYKLHYSSGIKQIEDGQRGPTNVFTKKIFSINKYYIYDGTEERAVAIDIDRNKSDVKEQLKLYKEKDFDNSKINNKDANVQDPRDENLLGQFSVDRDSLSAFNILTNMGTLDADLIYHDFKELIVELNFFDKEDLTEVEFQTFEWPTPEVGTRNWPYRGIEKLENEFGTLVHSKHLLQYFKDQISINEGLLTPTEKDWSEEGNNPTANAEITTVAANNENAIQAKVTNFASPYNELVAYSNKKATNVGESNLVDPNAHSAKKGKKSPSNYTVEQYLKSTREMCEYINAEGYDYCVYRLALNCDTCSAECKALSDTNFGNCAGKVGNGACSCEQNHCKHNPHNNSNSTHSGCILPTYFEESQQSISKHNMCCATLVSWSLSKLELMEGAEHNEKGCASFIKGELEAEEIAQGEPLQPGDILVYDGHIDINGEAFEGGFKKYNGGHYAEVGAQEGGQNSCIQNNGGWQEGSSNPPICALRIPWGKKPNEDPYKGYKGGELVVSPVTGVVLEAGNKAKITNIETGKIEYVGYIKIRVLDAIDFNKLFGGPFTTNPKKGDEDLEGFKYFLDEYMTAEVAGNIFYMEGFSQELFSQSGNTISINSDASNCLSNGKAINQYTPVSYEDVFLSEKARKELEDEEGARSSALPTYEHDGMMLIKEGTAIGTTYTDGDGTYEKLQQGLNDLRIEKGKDVVDIKPDEPLDADDPINTRKLTVRPGISGENGSYKLTDEDIKKLGNGNYMRYIMRTSKDGTDNNVEKDSIIENVENYLEIASSKKETLGKIEEFMYWQAKEPEGFEFIIDGVESYAYAVSKGAGYVAPARRDNASDKYGHDYGIDGAENNDINLCPGMCFLSQCEGNIKIWQEVTGQSAPTSGDCSFFCTGEELLDIYQQILDAEVEWLRSEFPALKSLDDEDTRIFALIDVSYAGAGNFKVGDTLYSKLKSGNLDLTLDDFLANAGPSNTFYSQNPQGLRRRRIMDYYIYAEGKYGCDLYDKSDMDTEIAERYEFISETPFQDLMVDKEGAERVSFE